MNIRLVISIFLFLTSSVANAAFVVTSFAGNNVTSSVIDPHYISAFGFGYGPLPNPINPGCCAGQNSGFTVNFNVSGTQAISIAAFLNSSGGSMDTLANVNLYKVSPNENLLGAYSQAVLSSLASDPNVTHYADASSLNVDAGYTLTAGNYVLEASGAVGLDDIGGSASYIVSMAAVPLPSSGILFFSAIALVAIRKTNRFFLKSN